MVLISPEKYLQLIGHSIHHPGWKEIVEAFEMEDNPVIDYFGWARMENESVGITFEFEIRKKFVQSFGEPKSVYTNDANELILKEITFDNRFQHNKKPFSIPLPFDLKAGDAVEFICHKLNKKPFEKSKGSDYQHAYYFLKDEARILTALDENYQLLWFRIFYIDLSMRKRMALKKSLQQQHKNLTTKNTDKLELLRQQMPAKKWQRRMKEGDTAFTVNNIAASEELLDDFFNGLHQAIATKKANKVLASIKKVVTGFNRLNEKFDSFVKTMEREELIGYITTATRLTGFTIDQGFDITEEWREW